MRNDQQKDELAKIWNQSKHELHRSKQKPQEQLNKYIKNLQTFIDY